MTYQSPGARRRPALNSSTGSTSSSSTGDADCGCSTGEPATSREALSRTSSDAVVASPANASGAPSSRTSCVGSVWSDTVLPASWSSGVFLLVAFGGAPSLRGPGSGSAAAEDQQDELAERDVEPGDV